jgi:D-arginine dehydrogenase
MSRRADIAIIGAGIAGASLAAEVAPHASVLLLEAEDQAGYHSTGRSAAFWLQTYGGAYVQPLTTASGRFLREGGYLFQRGGLHLADAAGTSALDAMERGFAGDVDLVPLDRAQLDALIPGLRPPWTKGLLEPSCSDIDVAALHGFYLAEARRHGARLVTGARLVQATSSPKGWSLATTAGTFEASVLADAAGAWADLVAEAAGVRPLGIRPYRRTVAQIRVAPPAPPGLPLVIDALERFYFKPEAGGRLWLSPHDETPTYPCDCAPEELDVAVAIDRFQGAVDWRVEQVERRWAGLRSFAPDRLPVYGFAPGRRDFFWFAGQGGFGIQTAPAAARLAGSLLLGTSAHDSVAAIDPGPYDPGRLAN